MKHSLTDLNDYLFEQLDALSNADLEGEQLDAAIKRAEAVADIATTVVQNANVIVKAATLQANQGDMAVLNRLALGDGRK